MKTLKGQDFYALLCDRGHEDWIICGVFSTKKEAKEIDEEVKDCPCKHKVVKCEVSIRY